MLVLHLCVGFKMNGISGGARFTSVCVGFKMNVISGGARFTCVYGI